MNREEIIAKWDGMTARERDAWVAEVVTKVPRERRRINCPDGDRGCAVIHFAYYPNYSTDTSAAWTVVEAAEWSALINYTPTLTRANFHRNGWAQYDVYATKAPEAICLAALLAKLTEVIAN